MTETPQALLTAQVEVVWPKYIKRGDKILLHGLVRRDGKRTHMPRLVEHVSAVAGGGFVFLIAATEREFGGQEVVNEHDTVLRVMRDGSDA